MSSRRIIRQDPIARAVMSYGFLLGLCLLVQTWLTGSSVQFWNTVVPMAVLILGLSICISLVKGCAVYAISPIPWFYLASTAYFGFGPLAATFANPETISYIDWSSGYPIDAFGIFEANLLSVAGIFSVSVAIWLSRQMLPWSRYMPEIGVRTFDVRRTELVLWVFLAVGGTAKFTLSLPHALGLISLPIPGIIQHLSWMLTAAIIIVMLLVQRGARRYIPVMWVLITVEIATAIMTTSKTAVLFTLIAIALGRFLWKPSLRFILISAFGTIAFYSLILSPFVVATRVALLSDSFTIDAFMGVVAPYYESGTWLEPFASTDESEFKVQSWWARLNYTNYQKFAIDSYNSGNPGDSLNEVYYILAPRILFPEKPIIGYGRILSDLLNPGSGAWVLTAMGMFAEGYWNAGVAGLVGICLWAGFVLTGFTRFAFIQLEKGRFAMFLPLLGGLQCGIGVDWWYVGTFVGG